MTVIPANSLTGVQVSGQAGLSIDQLVRELVAQASQASSATGSRDVGPDVTPQPGTLPAVVDPDQDRFFGSVFKILLPTCIKVASQFLPALQAQRRELGLPEERDAAAIERDFGIVLSGLLQKLVEGLPGVVEALSGQRSAAPPENPEEVTQRWFLPLLTTLGPLVAQAIPGIVKHFSGGRDIDADNAPITSPEIADRFFPALFGPLAAGLMQAAPGLIKLFHGQRDLTLTFDAFSGHWMPSGDAIRMIETDIGDPNVIEFQLRQPHRTWFKGLEVWIAGTRVQELTCEGRRRESDIFRIDVGQLTGTGFLRFVKAAAFGVHTGFYELRGLEQKRGRRLTFEWLHD